MTPRLLRLAGLAGIAILMAACGGTTATASPSGAPTDAPTATAAASEAPTDAPASEPAASFPNLDDLFGSVELLDGLDSYVLTVEMVGSTGDTTMAVTSIREPVVATRAELNTSGQAISIIRIGDEAWLSQGGMAYTAVPPATVDMMINLLSPERLFAAFQGQEVFESLTAAGTGTKNGVQATHYRIDDQTPLPPGSATVPPGMTTDLWVSDEGLLVSFEVTGLDTEVQGQGTIESMKVNVTNINDPALSVERPE